MAKNKKAEDLGVATKAPEAQADNAGAGDVSTTANGDAIYVPGAQATANPAATTETAKPKEDKATRFRRLASRRVSKALKAITFVANLGNKSQYGYTEAQTTKIIESLTARLESVKQAFAGSKQKSEVFEV